MTPPDVTIHMGGRDILVTEDNCWVCLFLESPQYDHLYIYEPDTFVIFDCREVLDQLLHLGYPVQTRRLPKEWDERAFDKYIEGLTSDLAELDEP